MFKESKIVEFLKNKNGREDRIEKIFENMDNINHNFKSFVKEYPEILNAHEIIHHFLIDNNFNIKWNHLDDSQKYLFAKNILFYYCPSVKKHMRLWNDKIITYIYDIVIDEYFDIIVDDDMKIRLKKFEKDFNNDAITNIIKNRNISTIFTTCIKNSKKYEYDETNSRIFIKTLERLNREEIIDLTYKTINDKDYQKNNSPILVITEEMLNDCSKNVLIKYLVYLGCYDNKLYNNFYYKHRPVYENLYLTKTDFVYDLSLNFDYINMNYFVNFENKKNNFKYMNNPFFLKNILDTLNLFYYSEEMSVNNPWYKISENLGYTRKNLEYIYNFCLIQLEFIFENEIEKTNIKKLKNTLLYMDIIDKYYSSEQLRDVIVNFVEPIEYIDLIEFWFLTDARREKVEITYGFAKQKIERLIKVLIKYYSKEEIKEYFSKLDENNSRFYRLIKETVKHTLWEWEDYCLTSIELFMLELIPRPPKKESLLERILSYKIF